MKIVPINGVGKVAFPDNIQDGEMQAAAQKASAQRPIGLHEVLQHLVGREPKGGNSESYAKMTDVAKVLEQTPALLQLAIAGLRSSQPLSVQASETSAMSDKQEEGQRQSPGDTGQQKIATQESGLPQQE